MHVLYLPFSFCTQEEKGSGVEEVLECPKTLTMKTSLFAIYEEHQIMPKNRFGFFFENGNDAT